MLTMLRRVPLSKWFGQLIITLVMIAALQLSDTKLSSASANPLLPDEFRRGNSYEFYFQSNRPLVPPVHRPTQNHAAMPLDVELELRRQMDSLAALCRSLSENANVYIENQSPFRRAVPCKTVLTRHFLETNQRPITLPPRHVGTVNTWPHTTLPPPPPRNPMSAPMTTTKRPRRVQYVNMFRSTTVRPTHSTPVDESFESDDIEASEATPTSTISPRVLKSNTNVEKLKIALRNYHLRKSTSTSTTTTDLPSEEDVNSDDVRPDHSVSGSAPQRTHIVTFKRDDLRTTSGYNNRTTMLERRPLNEPVPKKFKLTTAHVAYILIGSCCGASVFSLIVVAATMRGKKHDHRFPHRYTLKKCLTNPVRTGKGSAGSGKPGCLYEMWSFGDVKFGDAKSLYFRRLPFGTASSLSAGGTATVGSNAQPPPPHPVEGEESIHCTCLVHVNSRTDAPRHVHKTHNNNNNNSSSSSSNNNSNNNNNPSSVHQQRNTTTHVDNDPALAAVFLSTNRDCLV